MKRERSLIASITDKTFLTWESLCVFPEVTSSWLKSSRKKGNKKHLSITESEVLLPRFVLLCKRLSPCSQRGGHRLKTSLSFCHSSQHENLNPKGKTSMYVFCVWKEEWISCALLYLHTVAKRIICHRSQSYV